MSPTELKELFNYHSMSDAQCLRSKVIRLAALELAVAINDCCPESADKSAAIRKVREAVFTANAAIALESVRKTLALHATEQANIETLKEAVKAEDGKTTFGQMNS